MDAQTFLNNLGTIADAPGGIQHVRKLILELAVRGALVNQDASEGAQELKATVNGPFQIPQSWSWLRLSDFVKFKVGKTPPTKDPGFWGDSESTMWVSISDMTNGGFVTESARRVTKRARADVFKHDPWPTGTMLMSFKLTIGKVSRLGQPAYFNEAIMSFDSGNPSTNEFLFRVLPLLSQSANAKGAIKGNTLNSDSISNILIPLPPEPEQVRIVSKVDELVDLCDELEAAKNKRASLRTAARKSAIDAISTATTPDELTQAWKRISSNWISFSDSQKGIALLRLLIIELAVQGRLHEGASLRELSSDGMPSHWTRGQLEDFADYIQRGKGPKYVDRSPIPVVSQKCVKWSGFDLSEARFVDPLSLSSYKEDRFLRMGDLLWNSTGTGTVGRTALYVPSDKFPKVVADSHVTIVRTTSLLPRFLWCWSASPAIQAQVLGATTGSTNQQELNLSTIKALPIAFPTEDEQREIVERVDQLMLLCDELEKSLETRRTIQQNLATSVSQFV